MSSTVLAQILDRIDAVLKLALEPACKVYRERTDAQCIEEAPSVNVFPRDGSSEAFGEDVDRDEMHIELKFYVREEPPTPAAEALHQVAHQALIRDAQLQTLVARLRRMETAFDAQAADTTALIKTVRYRAQYLTPSNTL